MLARAGGWGDVGDHHRARVPQERVPEHLREFAPAERHVVRAHVQRADALLERQERLVDLGTLQSGLAIVLVGVRAALAAGEVDEGKLAVDQRVVRVLLRLDLPRHRRGHLGDVGGVVVAPLERELKNRVRPRRFRVCARASGAPRGGSVLDEALHELHVVHLELLQSHDAHLRTRILPNDELLPPVEQVVNLAAVNLEKRHPQRQTLVVGLRQFREDLASRARGQRGHGVRLAAARLPVREAGHLAPVEDGADERVHRRSVNLVVVDVLRVHVVEQKLVLLRVLGEVHLLPGFPQRQLTRAQAGRPLVWPSRGVAIHRDDVLLIRRRLLFVQRSLAHHDSDAGLLRRSLRRRRHRRLSLLDNRKPTRQLGEPVHGRRPALVGEARRRHERFRLGIVRVGVCRFAVVVRGVDVDVAEEVVVGVVFAAVDVQQSTRGREDVAGQADSLREEVLVGGGDEQGLEVVRRRRQSSRRRGLVQRRGSDVRGGRERRDVLLRVDRLQQPEELLLVRHVRHPVLGVVLHHERRELRLCHLVEPVEVLDQSGLVEPLADSAGLRVGGLSVGLARAVGERWHDDNFLPPVSVPLAKVPLATLLLLNDREGVSLGGTLRIWRTGRANRDYRGRRRERRDGIGINARRGSRVGKRTRDPLRARGPVVAARDVQKKERKRGGKKRLVDVSSAATRNGRVASGDVGRDGIAHRSRPADSIARALSPTTTTRGLRPSRAPSCHSQRTHGGPGLGTSQRRVWTHNQCA